MGVYSAILYTSIGFLALAVVLWYMSGSEVKKSKPALSRKMVYIGGFFFSFSIIGFLLTFILWAT